MIDYLKFYEEYYQIKWNREKYEVHHIDGNRENCEINNLVLLPKELHRRLHAILMGSGSLTPASETKTLKEAIQEYMKAELNGYSDWDLGVAVYSIMEVIGECRAWGLLKNLYYNNATYID